MATVMRGTGAHSGEVFSLTWQNVLFNGQGGMIQILTLKTEAAPRILPMVPRVYEALKSRHEAAGSPVEG